MDSHEKKLRSDLFDIKVDKSAEETRQMTFHVFLCSPPDSIKEKKGISTVLISNEISVELRKAETKVER